MDDVKSIASIKKKKGKLKSIVFIISGSVAALCWIVGVIIFLINMIPMKYYGTYVRYDYNNGVDGKITYKISPLSVKATYESIENGKKKTKKENFKYYKKGNDLIIEDKSKKIRNYLIIDGDFLYVYFKKDISTSKKYKLYYWNVKSSKADFYEIENKSKKIETLIEESMDTWTRKSIYDTFEKELSDNKFYIFPSSEKTDETDLYYYEVVYDAAGGKLNLYYDRETKVLKRVYFSGSYSASTYTGVDSDSMSVEDIYDARAMLFSLMYILGNKDNIELNIDDNSKNIDKYKVDLKYRQQVLEDYLELIKNRQDNEDNINGYKLSLENDKYSVEFNHKDFSTDYTSSGIVSFNISVE